MLASLILTACGNAGENINEESDPLPGLTSHSERETESETVEPVTEECVTETETEKETEAVTEDEIVTEGSDEEITTEETASETTEAVPIEEETKIVSTTALPVDPTELSDSDIMEIISDNISFFQKLVCIYPDDYEVDNYWKYIFCTVDHTYTEYSVWPHYISNEDVIRWSHVMFSEFESIPDIPEDFSSAIEKQEDGYIFYFGDPAQRMIEFAGVTCENGSYIVDMNVYGEDIYKPFCTYEFTLTRNDYYDSRVSWDMPFSICDISVSPDDYKESYIDGMCSGGGILEVTEESANLRSTPDKTISDNIVGVVHKGDRFIVYGYDGYWYYIDNNGTNAYISHKMVTEIAQYWP